MKDARPKAGQVIRHKKHKDWRRELLFVGKNSYFYREKSLRGHLEGAAPLVSLKEWEPEQKGAK